MPKTKDVVHEQLSLVPASFLLAGCQQTWRGLITLGERFAAPSFISGRPNGTFILISALSPACGSRDVFYDVRNDTTRPHWLVWPMNDPGRNR